MKFDIRTHRYSEERFYNIVKLTIDNVTHDLGMLDADESKYLASLLREAAEELFPQEVK